MRFHDWVVDVDILALADTIGAVCRLIFFGRIPRPRVMNYMICRLDINSESDSER